MINIDIINKLQNCFDKGFVNRNNEFIAEPKANSYFLLNDCETELDVKCKCLEWLSRDAYKTMPFYSKKANDRFRSYIQNGINKYLETNFTLKDFEIIYQYLGNRVNHTKTIEFVNSGYDLNILEPDKDIER
jgi:hypothetical protein